MNEREPYLDGLRGFSALAVAVAHAQFFRYGNNDLVTQVRDVLSKLGTVGVQIFFVISGYIIVTLLLREQRETGRICIPAFYARRFFRIVPPLLCYLCFLVFMRISGDNGGMFYLEAASVLSAALFTCNTTLFGECQWFVGHSWSLAVEEQFYIGLPLALLLLRPEKRAVWAGLLVGLTLVLFLRNPAINMSNELSFACISVGVLYALVPRIQEAIERSATTVFWIIAAILLVMQDVPSFQVVNPFLLLYLIFSAKHLPWLRWFLESRPLQWLGLCSYSLYLWQQFFLADPKLYITQPPPIILLPVAAIASTWIVERNSIRLGRRVSDWLKSRSNRQSQA
jgi:peptidoglycan/LPS O-acetylase OafA/YrhL